MSALNTYILAATSEKATFHPMRIHIINPNTTVSMTRKIEAAARAAASPGVDILAANPTYGPPSIEGYFDEAFSLLRRYARTHGDHLTDVARQLMGEPSSRPALLERMTALAQG